MTEEKQTELFKADVTWFHIFKEIIRNGTWAKLTTNAKAIYPVVKAFANWETGSAFPSIDTLQHHSGLARASVIKALKELESQGLLIKNAEKGKSSAYSLIEQFDVKDDSGNKAASVTFDYIPASAASAIAEFKRMLADGFQSPDGKTNFIKIQNLNVNIHTGSGSNMVNNILSGLDEATLIKGIRDMARNSDSKEAQMLSELVEKYTNENIPPRD